MDGEWVVVRRKSRPDSIKSSSTSTSGAVSDGKNREKNQKKRAARKRAKARQAAILPEVEEQEGGKLSPGNDEDPEPILLETPKISDTKVQQPMVTGVVKVAESGHAQARTVAAPLELVQNVVRDDKSKKEEDAELSSGDEGEGENGGGQEGGDGHHARSQSQGGIIQSTVGWLGRVFGGSGRSKPVLCAPDDKDSELDLGQVAPSDGSPLAQTADVVPDELRKRPPAQLAPTATSPVASKAQTGGASLKPGTMPSPSSLPSSKKAKSVVDSDWSRGSFLLTAFGGETSGGSGGHNELVSGVAMDGDLAVSCGWDSVVKLWRWEQASASHGASRLCITKTLRGHGDRVECVAILDAGAGSSARRVLSAGRDCTLRVWNASSGAELHKSYIYESAKCLALVRSSTGGGEMAVVGSRSGAILLWDVEAGRKSSSLKGHSDEATCLRVLRGNAASDQSQGGDTWRVASGCADGSVRVWDVRTGSPVSHLAGQMGRVYSMKESDHDGEQHLLYVGDFSGTLKCHDLRMTRGTPPRAIANAPPLVGVRAPIAGVGASNGVLVSAAAGFWDEEVEDDEDEEGEVEGCLQFRRLGASSEKGGGAEQYLYTVRPGGGLITCLEMEADRVLGGDVNGTLFGLSLARGGKQVEGDGKQTVGVRGKSLGGCESLSDEDEDESEEDDEGYEEEVSM